MPAARAPGPLRSLRRLETREALLLALFATLVVLSRAALRWHLHVPGHAMLGTVLFLVLARGCVPRAGAASTAGLLAGVACTLLGMGRGGPIIAVKLALPGAVVDAAAAASPRTLSHPALAAAVGGAAGATGFLPTAAVEWLVGAPREVILGHAALSAGAKAAFGAVGGVAAVAVLRRLRAHGVGPAAAGTAPADPGASGAPHGRS